MIALVLLFIRLVTHYDVGEWGFENFCEKVKPSSEPVFGNVPDKFFECVYLENGIFKRQAFTKDDVKVACSPPPFFSPTKWTWTC